MHASLAPLVHAHVQNGKLLVARHIKFHPEGTSLRHCTHVKEVVELGLGGNLAYEFAGMHSARCLVAVEQHPFTNGLVCELSSPRVLPHKLVVLVVLECWEARHSQLTGHCNKLWSVIRHLQRQENCVVTLPRHSSKGVLDPNARVHGVIAHGASDVLGIWVVAQVALLCALHTKKDELVTSLRQERVQLCQAGDILCPAIDGFAFPDTALSHLLCRLTCPWVEVASRCGASEASGSEGRPVRGSGPSPGGLSAAGARGDATEVRGKHGAH
mmetsp:Transcript_40052/g.113484  ORF Transcript_40052/g.113484 Transcript_40052/m.113484 type:complete len:271 (+) Transcript_40052:795-1607(+)